MPRKLLLMLLESCYANTRLRFVFISYKYFDQLATALLTDYVGVGCFLDKPDRAIPTLEDIDSILDGSVFSYKSRQNAIVKCAVAARKRGFPAFALQDGGWCAASATALETFYKYGKSSDCKNDGKGGPFANNVYVFQDEVNRKFFAGVYIQNITTSIELTLEKLCLMFIISGSI